MKNIVSRLCCILFLVLMFSCASIQDKTVPLQERESIEVIGRVEAKFVSFQPIHIVSSKSIASKAYSRLMAEARKKYEGNIEVVNIIADGSFNALSLLPPLALGFGIVLGNFQTIRASGDVISIRSATASNIRRPNSAATSGIEGAMNNAAEVIMHAIARNAKLAIVNVSSTDRELSEFVANELEYLLVNNRYTVVDRSELDRIRREQNFQLSGDVDDNTIVSVGRFAGADIVLTGAITGTGETRRLRLRALNTQTAQVMAVASERF